MKEHKPKEYIIPKNYTTLIPVAEWIKVQNLGEAVAMTLLLSKGISLIPFVFEIKTAVMLIGCGTCFLVFLIGYKEESILSYLGGYASYKLRCGVKRIRIPSEVKVGEENEEGKLSQSKYEKLVETIKRRFN